MDRDAGRGEPRQAPAGMPSVRRDDGNGGVGVEWPFEDRRVAQQRVELDQYEFRDREVFAPGCSLEEAPDGDMERSRPAEGVEQKAWSRMFASTEVIRHSGDLPGDLGDLPGCIPGGAISEGELRRPPHPVLERGCANRLISEPAPPHGIRDRNAPFAGGFRPDRVTGEELLGGAAQRLRQRPLERCGELLEIAMESIRQPDPGSCHGVESPSE